MITLTILILLALGVTAKKEVTRKVRKSRLYKRLG